LRQRGRGSKLWSRMMTMLPSMMSEGHPLEVSLRFSEAFTGRSVGLS
jgi:hypothetical protein